MKRVVRAIEAKVHLRKVVRRVREEQEVIVMDTGSDDWWQKVEEVREAIKAEMKGRPLPPAEEVIREMREERDEQILESLR